MSANDGSDQIPNPAETNGDLLDASQLAEARLTAYVVGELDAGERAAVDSELAASDSLRQQVAEIRRSVELVTAALGAKPFNVAALPKGDGSLRPAECLLRTQQPAIVAVRRTRPRISTRYALAASLVVCLGGGTAWLMWPELQAAREAARRTAAVREEQVGSVLRIEHVGGGLQHDINESATSFPAPINSGANVGLPAKERMSDRLRSARIQTEADLSRYKGMATDITYPDVENKSRLHGLLEDTTVPPYQSDDVQYSPSGPEFRLSSRSQGLGALDFDRNSLIDSSKSMSGDTAEKTIRPGPRLLIQGEEEPLEGFRESRDGFNTESYDRIFENPFLDVRQNPLSTFSIDVDTASYANVRRFLNGGSLPPRDAVRIEELLNYFTYHYAPPTDDKPFAVHAEVAGCPWEPKHRLLRLALKGKEIDLENRPAGNLVFLIDVSGSMDDPAKLPLLKGALHLLVDKLGENDRVAMVVYAGSSGVVLPSTSGLYKETILAALDQLQAGGSTNGASGIQLAYQAAREKFIKGGTNRVILCTDGDFNVGVTDDGSLTRLIEDEAKSGVFLSVLGFGTGNLKDSTMENLADRGNGNYAYIDTANEARKVLVEQLGGTLVTIAKDVKLQLEFNPRQVTAYRLLGYENRLLRAEDFNDDKKDAGEIGAGHTVTALYEIVPAGGEAPTSKVDGLKYQRTTETTDAAASDELLTLKLRYKEPDADTSRLIESVVKDGDATYARASEDYRFAAAVAGFGLLLRDSQFKGDLTWGAVLELAEASRGTDESGYRAEFIELVKRASKAAGK